MPHEQYQSFIEKLHECVVQCKHCAAECLAESDVTPLAECIKLDMECAEICALTLRAMAGGSDYVDHYASVCAMICLACSHECSKHVEMPHCRETTEVCRKTAEELKKIAVRVKKLESTEV